MSTSFDGYVVDQGGEAYNIANPAYGAKGDTVQAPSGGSIAAASTTLTISVPGVAFVAGDLGKVVTVQGAGASGAVLSTTIAAVLTSTKVMLTHPALAGVSNAGFSFGTDDTVAITAAASAASATNSIVFAPAGIYTILGSSYNGDESGGSQIHLLSRGGLLGQGGAGANTVFLCADETAGISTYANARYQGFMCDGNNVATTPLWNGVVTGPDTVGTTGGVGTPTGGLPTGVPAGTVTDNAVSYGTFVDVWATRSAGNGWAIMSCQNNSYYHCGTTDNAQDGLYLDGGAGGHDFFNFYERGSLRYGVYSDTKFPTVYGYEDSVQDIRFFGGTFDADPGRRGVSKVFLQFAYDWRFLGTKIVGTNLTGPTVSLDQTQLYGHKFVGCWIWATPKQTNPGNACVHINGVAIDNNHFSIVKTDGCAFVAGDNSVIVTSNNEYYVYPAIGWLFDATTHGPAAPSPVSAVTSVPHLTLPAADALLVGRTGAWQQAALAAGWTGAVYYRIMAEGWVQLKGSAQSQSSTGGAIFTLPIGYRPLGGATDSASAYHLRAATYDSATSTSGVGLLTIQKGSSENGSSTSTNPGDVSFSAIAGAGTYVAGTAVYLDGAAFSVRGDLDTNW